MSPELHRAIWTAFPASCALSDSPDYVAALSDAILLTDSIPEPADLTPFELDWRIAWRLAQRLSGKFVNGPNSRGIA